MEIEKTTYVNTLYDFYGDLLTEKQQDYLAMYYRDDLSLGEIAEECQVSRQAVYDNIKRSEQLLRHYETHLQLVAQFQSRQQAYAHVQQYITTHYPNDVTLQTLLEDMRG